MIGIVIPTWNRRDLLRACLESILTQTPPEPGWTVLVVDNGSTDGTPEMLDEMDISCMRSEQNMGFAIACNAGFGALYSNRADLDRVVFLNNDTYIHDPLWLNKLSKPKAAIVGCRLVYEDGTTQHTGVSLAYEADGVLHGHNQKQERNTGPVEAVTGACMAVIPETFAALGGFYEGFYNGNEDVDLCLKARREGHQVWYLNELTITHYESQSGPERWKNVGQNVALLTQRWPELPPSPLAPSTPMVESLAPPVSRGGHPT